MAIFPNRALSLLAALAAATPADAASLAFAPASLDFGSVALTESKLAKATLKNGTALAVKITGVRLGGANAADFTQANNCPASLPAGTSCVFSVTFKPAALTARSANLNVSTDDPAAPTIVLTLKGNAYPAVLDDTGITGCGNASAEGLPCPAVGFPRQDAEYGRDRLHNNNANGHAGFTFTKLDANGKALPASAPAWSCVRDNATGLVWERKPKADGKLRNQGLHDADDNYSWYSTDSSNNNGLAGYPQQGDTCYGYDGHQPASWCNTEAYVKRVNAQGWCGAKDWRLPTYQELLSLVDLSVPKPGRPTIDTGYFPDTLAKPYWTSSSYASNPTGSWIVYFLDGNSSRGDRYNVAGARLVRGGQ